MKTPAVEVQKIICGKAEIHVVRDDLLPGGSKQRAALPYVQKLKRMGYKELIYASPFSGFAQVALAHACKVEGLPCTVFAARDPSVSQIAPHEFTKLAQNLGAQIILSEDLLTSERMALEYESTTRDVFKIPLGFNDHSFNFILRKELRIQWSLLCKTLKYEPKSLWIALGSGTMARALRHILPEEVELNVVDVHVLPESDKRIKEIRKMKNVCYHSASQFFHEPCDVTPPVPSNKYYDAKVWTSLLSDHGPGKLWWNIAR